MKDVEISIKGLIFYILKRWKSILVGMLVCALAFCGFKYYKDSRVLETTETSFDETVAEKLSDQEREYLDSLYVYVQNMRNSTYEREKSLIMRIDPNNTVRKDVSYLIRVDDPSEMEGIKQAYEQALNGITLRSYLSDETGLPVQDLIETVSASVYFTDAASSTASITVKILSDNMENAEMVVVAVNSFLSDESRQLVGNGFEHELTATGEHIYQGPDRWVLENQTQYSSDIQAKKKSILDIETGLKDEQLEYYMFISEEENADNHADSIEQHHIGATASISKKYLLLGLFVGMLFVCGLYSVIFIYANRLDVDDDVEGVFGTYLIGTITGKDFGKTIYKLQHFGKRTFDYDESVRLISTKIKMSLRKDGASRIGILGCGIKKNNEKTANDLVALLKEEGIEAVIIDDPIYDSVNAEKLSLVERVVLLEKAEVTYRSEIWKEIELIKKLCIKAEGLIVAE